MEEEDDPGMGVIKRRRSRRLLEGRKVAASPSEGRITTASAAAAWGDMLVAEVQQPERAGEPPRAPLRGVPLSSRPPVAMPPEDAPVEQMRPPPPERPARALPEVRTPERLPSGAHSIVIDPLGTARPVVPHPGGRAPDTGPPRQLPPVIPASEGHRPLPPVSGQVELPRPQPFGRPSGGMAAVTPGAMAAAVERLEAEAASKPITLELPAVHIKGRSRPLWMDLTLGILLLGAGVWTAAVIFDAMSHTERLDRVGKALSTGGQRIMREHPGLPAWVGPAVDPVAIKALKENEVPRLVEAVSASGYAAGVFTVTIVEEPGRLVLEARLPEAVVAYSTEGVWVQAPPETGLVAALSTNLVSILGSFAVPLVAWGALAVLRRRTALGPRSA